MMYRLPTRAKRTYRGKYPDVIHSISLGGTDIDGNKSAHIETNDGHRYTISYGCMDMPLCNQTSRYVGMNMWVFVLSPHKCVDMHEQAYNDWLADIREKRGY